MATLTTTKFKRSLADNVYSDIMSRRQRYYTFFGNQNDSVILDDIETNLNVRHGLISAKRIYSSDVQYVVPRFNWTNGTVYSKFQYNLQNIVTSAGPKFYVLTDQNNTFNVYKCLDNNKNSPSTIIPTGNDSDPIVTSDGYTWQYLYTIPKIIRQKFLTGEYMPVFQSLQSRFFSIGQIDSFQIINTGSGYAQHNTTIEIEGDGTGAVLHPIIRDGKLADVILVEGGKDYTRAKAIVKSTQGAGARVVLDIRSGDLETDQQIVEILSTPGTIDSIDIIEQGAGYVSADVIIEGDGTDARGQAVISLGKIDRILITSRGKNYNWAKIKIVGQVTPQAPTTEATARANISPHFGHGRNAVDDLFSTQLMINSNIYSDRLQDHDIGSVAYNRHGIARDFRNNEYQTFLHDSVTSRQYVIESEFGPYISITGGGGIDAKAIPTITGEYVDLIGIEDSGNLYTEAPSVSFGFESGFSAPVGYVAPEAEAVIHGQLSSISVNYPGVGFSSSPLMQTSGGSSILRADMTTGIRQININSAGSGYTSAPTISFTGGGGTGASAIAYVSSGKIAKIVITNPGKDYTSSPTVSFSGGGGTGAVVTAILTTEYSVIKNITIDQSYDKYQTAPAVFTNSGCGIYDIEVLDSGQGFTVGNSISFSGGGGTGLQATAVIEDCVRTITVTNPGTGYTSAPSVVITGAGSGAVATSTISQGKVVSIKIESRGYNYTVAPTISFSGGGGSGAAAVAQVSSGIQMIHITNPGTGYTSTPRVQFSGQGQTGFSFAVKFAKPELTSQISGSLVKVNMISKGQKVGNNLTVSVTGNAVVYPQIRGILTNVEVIGNGSGYTTPPTVVLGSEIGSGAKLQPVVDPVTKTLSSVLIINAGSGYPISSIADYRLGDVLVDLSKNEFTVLQVQSNANNDKAILVRSNAGFPVEVNQKFRKKQTQHQFKVKLSKGTDLVESRFPIAAYKVLTSFQNTNAIDTDFQIGDIVMKYDQTNGDKYFKIISKKAVIGTDDFEFLVLPTYSDNGDFSGGELNKSDVLVLKQNLGKQMQLVTVSTPELDVYSGELLTISTSTVDFQQNTDQSVSIKTLLQF